VEQKLLPKGSSFFKLLTLSLREVKFLIYGANIGDLVILESIEIQGRLSNLTIGGGSFLGKGCFIATHEKVKIGRHVAINSGVKIFTASHDVNSPNWTAQSAEVIIEDFCWIATDAIILPGTIVSRGSIVGAGAVVSGLVKEGSVVAGNPAREIKTRKMKKFTYSPSRFSAVIQAWLGRS
jgi:maltose O-acetyltransferase